MLSVSSLKLNQIEKVSSSGRSTQLAKLQCRNTLLHVKILHSKFYLSKSTKVLNVPKVKVLILQNESHFRIMYITLLDRDY